MDFSRLFIFAVPIGVASLGCSGAEILPANPVSPDAAPPQTEPFPPSTTTLYTSMVGGSVPVAPGIQVGYALTASAPMTYQLRWTGDARVAADGFQQFYGSVWTAGHFSSLVPGCVDQACPLETGDIVSAIQQVPGGEQITWNTFASVGWDGFAFVTDTEPVYFDASIDGFRHPELFFFAAAPSGATATPAASPFGMVSAPSITDPFIGTWSCTAADTTTFTTPPNTPTAMNPTTATVAISDDGAGNITALRTPGNGAPPCTLRSHLNSDGVSSTLAPGQMCTSANSGTVTYASGSATMNGTSAYTTMSTWSYSGETAAGAALEGMGMGVGSCTRM